MPQHCPCLWPEDPQCHPSFSLRTFMKCFINALISLFGLLRLLERPHATSQVFQKPLIKRDALQITDFPHHFRKLPSLRAFGRSGFLVPRVKCPAVAGQLESDGDDKRRAAGTELAACTVRISFFDKHHPALARTQHLCLQIVNPTWLVYKHVPWAISYHLRHSMSSKCFPAICL